MLYELDGIMIYAEQLERSNSESNQGGTISPESRHMANRLVGFRGAKPANGYFPPSPPRKTKDHHRQKPAVDRQQTVGNMTWLALQSFPIHQDAIHKMQATQKPT